MSVDLLLRTPEQVRQRLAMQDSFLREIIERGKVAYEAQHAGMASTQEGIDKAEGDFSAALTLNRARKHPNYDTACYDTQQCAEKYLQARLEEAGQPLPRTHNLYALLPSHHALCTRLASNGYRSEHPEFLCRRVSLSLRTGRIRREN